MKQSVLPLLILVLGVPFLSRAQIDSTFQGKLSNTLIEQQSDYVVKYSHTNDLGNGLRAHFFHYKIKNKKFPYGSGFEITHPKRKQPLWYVKMNGDFGPHSLQLVDINSDGKLDLFFHAGFEDIFSTYIYTANYSHVMNSEYNPKNFLKAYSNENDYSVLLNIGNNSQPIILDSGYEGNDHRSGTSCFDNQSDLAIKPENKLTISDSIRQEIKKKYYEVTGHLDEYNFDYNMPKAYPLFNTKILDPIKLLKIEHNEPVDVTSEYPEYLNWRIDLLKTIRKESSEKCKGYIEKTIKHLERYF